MARFDIFDTIEDLRHKGQSFAVATVVRTADVTSAKAGAKAAVTTDGEILGHLGGACVQRAVRDAVTGALDEGQPRVIRVKPSDKVVAMHDPDGVQTYKSGCPSGGTVDVLIEPYQLPPKLVIFGATPISRAIAAHGALAGFVICAPDGVQTGVDSRGFDPEDMAALSLSARDFVVVAAQGQGDLKALRAAVDSPARRISMVASRRKAAALMEKLIAQGVPEPAVRRLKSPAGLDLKAVDPHEIALSVLAEIVKWRNTDTQTQEMRDEKLA
ncbi:MAG: XdhC family protein [Rhodobacteraceae bacterium]|nr:XdhC family protein [Paracoccaceae bacterium]